MCTAAALRGQEADQKPEPELSPAMYLMSLGSGTSLNPLAWPMPMLMQRKASWSLDYMGQAFLIDTQQSGPRGGDKLYSTNWGMASAQHSLGPGQIMFDTMLSLEPATVTNRSYPLLFQTGETAYGRPLTDAQHPHDFVMGLGAHYVLPVGEHTLLHFYYAGVGDPALGPVAFPHRASAAELPQATLGHHWEDSTHIASNVATVGVKYRWIRLEASGFHGGEPNENRWNIDWGGMDSYSARAVGVSFEELDRAVFRRPPDQARTSGSGRRGSDHGVDRIHARPEAAERPGRPAPSGGGITIPRASTTPTRGCSRPCFPRRERIS